MRRHAGREPTPSAACIDSPSVKPAERGGPARGYEGGKKLKGWKRMLVGTMGLVLAVIITSAARDDGAVAFKRLSQLSPREFPRLTVILPTTRIPLITWKHG